MQEVSTETGIPQRTLYRYLKRHREEGMHFWLDVGCVVKQNVEHIVTLMFVSTHDSGINGNRVGHQSIY